MFIGFKEFEIGNHLLIRLHINSWMIGFYFGRYAWIHFPMIEICINFTKGPMFGGEEDGD